MAWSNTLFPSLGRIGLDSSNFISKLHGGANKATRTNINKQQQQQHQVEKEPGKGKTANIRGTKQNTPLV